MFISKEFIQESTINDNHQKLILKIYGDKDKLELEDLLKRIDNFIPHLGTIGVKNIFKDIARASIHELSDLKFINELERYEQK